MAYKAQIRDMQYCDKEIIWIEIEDEYGVIYSGSLELDEEKSERLAKKER